jgi:putative ABC transport system permease protein
VFAAGDKFANKHEAVVGAEVARQLGYSIGTEFVLSHGIGEVGFHDHEEHGFHVSGILEPTGTPADRAVHVSLEALAEVHGSEAMTGLYALQRVRLLKAMYMSRGMTLWKR